MSRKLSLAKQMSPEGGSPVKQLDLADLRAYLRVDRVILFGSCIHSGEKQAHDVDLLVVSDSFHCVPSFKRKEIVRRCLRGNCLDPVCLTISEFRRMLSAPTDFGRS